MDTSTGKGECANEPLGKHRNNNDLPNDDKEDVASYKHQLARLQKQLEIANRKVINANHRSEAHEQYSKEAQLREEKSRHEAEKYRNELARVRERYHTMEQDLKMSKLRNECSVDRAKIRSLELQIREIESDPDRNLPSKVDQKRRLPKVKLELQRLRSKNESQTQLLENLEAMGNMNEAMQKAAVRDDILMVKRLLSRGINVNIQDESGYSAFMYACGHGHTEMASLMITSGEAVVNDIDSKLTPLILATIKCHEKTIQLLIDHGASVDQRDELNRTPLLIACEKESVSCARALLEAGANSNAIDKRGNSGLHHCAVSGNGELAKLLMDFGANDALKNNDLMTAIMIARSRRHFNVVDAICNTKASR